MKKLKLYLDTTIFNYVFADDTPKERDITCQFFKQGNDFELFISDVVLGEIDRCFEPKRKKMLELVSHHDMEILELNHAARGLAALYVKAGIIPIKYEADAFHVAIASVFSMDMILSWNFQHIVKFKTKREVAGINLLNGYQPLEIYSPMEVVDYVE